METKVCTSCGKTLPATAEYFHKAKLGILGLAAKCKSCKKAQIEDCHTKQDYNLIRRLKREELRKLNPFMSETERAEARRDSKRKYYQTEKGKLHRKICKMAHRANGTTRLTKEERRLVSGVYNEMRRLNKEVGYIAYHVDHIIPVSKGGKTVPNNLQILPCIDNLRKGAKLNDK